MTNRAAPYRRASGALSVRLLTILGLSATLLLLTIYSALAQSITTTYLLPGDNVYPEGIAYQRSTGAYFVGGTGDGTIYRGTLSAPEAAVFIPGGTEGMTGTRGLKVDQSGRLFVAGGPQGMIYVFNAANRQPLARLSTGVQPSFVNDLSVAPDGKVYATDSLSPLIYRVLPNAQGALVVEPWLTVSPTIAYTQGFNLNGIAVSADGRALLTVQGNVGKLYRVQIDSKQIVEVNLNGEPLTNADGIWLDGQTLYVLRNRDNELVTISLSPDLSSGSVVNRLQHPSFAFPTTLTKVENRLLVVNSQFDRRDGSPTLPFTVVSIALPQPDVVAQPTGSAVAPTPTAPLTATSTLLTPTAQLTAVPDLGTATPLTPGLDLGTATPLTPGLDLGSTTPTPPEPVVLPETGGEDGAAARGDSSLLMVVCLALGLLLSGMLTRAVARRRRSR